MPHRSAAPRPGRPGPLPIVPLSPLWTQRPRQRPRAARKNTGRMIAWKEMVTSSLPLILVIDDDDAVRKTCVEFLRALGHETLAAASVGDGLRLFAERRPAAVILALKLPDGTGIDVLRELQRQAPGIPVIVISGYGSVTEAVEAMKVGAA